MSNLIQFAEDNSVLRYGYGILGKAVMQDSALNKHSKLVYAYLVTFGNSAFPGRDKICSDLKIGSATFTKSINELVNYGYLRILKNRSSGRFTNYTYIINTFIDKS